MSSTNCGVIDNSCSSDRTVSSSASMTCATAAKHKIVVKNYSYIYPVFPHLALDWRSKTKLSIRTTITTILDFVLISLYISYS